ncbi:methylated-DNA--[protein]-cysteine S-methyltransferase [Nakamurella flava]|uniref:Methylated-DNA--protein-cysteine methyltransferase n=1 Tax=Nakamurella flava TaxID=2576308 RepID=A0A4U6QIM9_9ACTN|nr:methylated-DNA--[protein]-cysteine S-methyltransferase [Nakamurella flava]TKV60230.1 methylated-DNA--[protein]-cysteine S-methyltransferase [Nakamurella flava]
MTAAPPPADPTTPASAFGVSDAELAALQARLADRAEADGLLDIAYRTIDSPIGPLLLAATEHGVLRVAFAGEGFDTVLQRLADRVSARILATPARTDPVARQLDEYFTGRRRSFDVRLDRRLSAGFRAAVQGLLPGVEYGRTVSYAELAARAGNPKAVRAVGTACATNPLPIVVPCHRVLRADGSLGGYLGGPDTKRYLLDLERTATAEEPR